MKSSVLSRLLVLSAVVIAAEGSPLLAAGEGIKLSRSTVSGGGEVQGSVFLPAPASEDRKYVVEFLEATGVVTPGSVPVVVPVGRSEVKFSAKSSSVKSRVDIKVCLKPDAAAQTACIDQVALRIVPGILQSLSLNRTDAVGGATDQKVMGTVTLQDPAGPEGVQVSISQDLPLDTVPGEACLNGPDVSGYTIPVKTPPSVQVKPGNRSADFPIPTFPLKRGQPEWRQVTMTASLDGVAKAATLTVRRWGYAEVLTLAPAANTERIRTATLTMNAGAPFEVPFRLDSNYGTNATLLPGNQQHFLSIGEKTRTFQVEFASPTGACVDVFVAIEIQCSAMKNRAMATICPPAN